MIKLLGYLIGFVKGWIPSAKKRYRDAEYLGYQRGHRSSGRVFRFRGKIMSEQEVREELMMDRIQDRIDNDL